MLRLASMLFVTIATVLMGIAIVAVLTMQLDTSQPILMAAMAGFITAMPVTWIVARRILAGQETA